MIKKAEYLRRQKRLMTMMGKNSIAIIPSSEEQVRSRDTHYRFRQDSDFYYLSGYNEPSSVLVLIPGRKQGQSVLFNRSRDPEMETWHGRRSGQEGAIADFAVDDAFPIDDIDEILPNLIEGKCKVYYSLGNHGELDQLIIDWIKMLRSKMLSSGPQSLEIVDLLALVHEQRLIKSPQEIKVMRQAAKISADAHTRAIQATKPGKLESAIEGELTYHFAQANAPEHAYTPIVAGGNNACILHYTENDAELKAGDLLLIDAGCEYQNYASDISRTFPVSGKFSPAQQALYDIVYEAQLAAIGKVKPGNTWNQPHDAAVRVITTGLLQLGILKGDVKSLIADGAYRKFYMHKTGHWLGLDVHDVGAYQQKGKPRKLEPGMVMTVEPGIYIDPEMKGVAKKWLGIGIRIEDDVLVTENGNEVLTEGVPKSRVEIEAMMANHGLND